MAYLVGLVVILMPARMPADPALEVLIPQGPAPGELTAKERKRVNEAVDHGIAALRGAQLPNGSFGDGQPTKVGAGKNTWWRVGYAALPGLALLESNVAPDDPAVKSAARFVRDNAPALTRTYEISLAMLFLDRLGKAEDRDLIRSLGLRLAAGQTSLGGWGYDCPRLTAAQEKKLLQLLREQKTEENPKPFPLGNPKGRSEIADNSNTQFAILALWSGQKHELPLNYAIAQVERRFRSCQQPAGWPYRLSAGRANGSMTCAGLLGLAVGRGSGPDAAKGGDPPEPKPRDDGIASGLRALGAYLNDPTDLRAETGSVLSGPKGAINLYFLWSVERVGVLLNLKTIGGKDWYRWGMELLLAAQNKDGSWMGRGNGPTAPVIDTSMALLFLKKSDLLPDLRETLQKRLTITDPGLDLKNPIEKTPDDKKDPKGGDKKNPGDKGDSLKDADAPLVANLGEVKAKQATKLPLKVRGPVAFRITALRGADAQLQVAVPAHKQGREVHELALTLRPAKGGDFERTIYLTTDIPGRAEVAVQIQATAR